MRRVGGCGSRVIRALGVLVVVSGLLLPGCGYTTRPGLAAYLRTVYVKPFTNKIDLTQLTNDYQHFPVYRPGMESEVTNAVIRRFQFTGLMRIASPDKADSRIEGELVEFRRDALRYDASQTVEEWRLSVVVNARFYDAHLAKITWDESRLTGDATYFVSG